MYTIFPRSFFTRARLVNFVSQFIKVYTIIGTLDVHVPDDDDQMVYSLIKMHAYDMLISTESSFNLNV